MKARIFQSCEGSAGKNGFAFGVVAREFENDRVGKAGESHGLEFARTRPKLVEGSKTENCILAHSGLKQASNSVACVEGLPATMKDLNEANAICVRKRRVVHP